MNGLKRLVITILSVLTVGVGALGIAACDGFTIVPNNSGGVVVIPNSSQGGSQGGGNVEHQHVWNSGSVTKAATCEEKGEKVYKCLTCNETLTEELDALGHSEVKRNGKAATCTEAGWEEYTVCERVGCTYTTYEEIPALGHERVRYAAKAATCTAVGWEAYEACERCDYTTYVEIPVAEHSFENLVCTVCGADEPDHAHVWDEGTVTTEATCTEKGEKTYACANCEETKTEAIPMIAHDLEEFEAKEATCEAIGWFAYTVCKSCQYSTYTEVPVLGHSYGKGVVTTAATCTEKGVMIFTCFCGKTYTTEIEEIGHVFDEWSVSLAAKCESEGEEKRVCQNDATHVEIRAIKATGHDFGAWSVAKEATCAVVGEEVRACKNDPAHVEKRDIPKTDEHNVNADGICTACGKRIKDYLPGVALSDIDTYEDDNGMGIVWKAIDNATSYEVKIVMGETTEQFIWSASELDLEKYFKDSKYLSIQIRAIPAEDSDYVAAKWDNVPVYSYEIVGESIGETGIGQSINILKADWDYTKIDGGAYNIFDEEEFNKLRIVKIPGISSETTVVYGSDYASYVNSFSESKTKKFSLGASVGMGKAWKIAPKYEKEISESYEKKSSKATTTVFYDMTSRVQSKTMGIYGYNNAVNELSGILSEEFKKDALKVGNGQMDAATFIHYYGTHIITAGIYGATFDLHYEMVTTEMNLSETIKSGTSNAITAAVTANIYGVDVGVEAGASNSQTYTEFSTVSNASTMSTFNVKTRGAVSKIDANNLANFEEAYSSWYNNLKEEDYCLIDVPDNSLYCVWEFLVGEEYEETKRILNEYVYNLCLADYNAMKDKMGMFYLDFENYDEETGVLTVDLSALQDYSSANTAAINLNNFNNETGVYTVNSQYSVFNKETGAYEGKPIKKVVFKGDYHTLESGTVETGELIDNKFANFSIKFASGWKDDIVIEFENFAFIAPAGKTALDFSEVSSENITISVVNKAYIKGGDGSGNGANGQAGIFADGSNLTITGDSLEVYGGNGTAGSSSTGAGGAGGKSIQTQTLIINMNSEAQLYVRGGDGGAAYNRRSGDNSGDGANGRNGYAGGAGGIAIKAVNVTVNFGRLTVVGGNGGEGGDGSECNYAWGKSVRGGTGGNGGNGAVAIVASSFAVCGTKETISIEITGGSGGKTGRRGGCHSNDHGDDWADAGGASDGYNGTPGIAGLAISSDCVVTDSLSIIIAKNGSKGAVDTSLNQC